MQLRLKLHFTKGYIAHPYWPELEKLINVQKESGTRRARSEEKRIKVLRDYLTARGMSMEQYEELERRAKRPFYTVADLNGSCPPGHDPDEIVIPPHQLYGCLANACDLAGAGIRLARKEQIRSILSIAPVTTGKTEKDAKVWSRFCVVTAGAGNKLSNQRALRENPYIEQFTGETALAFSEDIVAEKRAIDFMRFLGREIGVGASRKLGWGRFDVEVVAA